ncbi:MAG: hypothetical protein AAFY20_10070 [Cyanobacteria bacterium J06639_14]
MTFLSSEVTSPMPPNGAIASCTATDRNETKFILKTVVLANRPRRK